MNPRTYTDNGEKGADSEVTEGTGVRTDGGIAEDLELNYPEREWSGFLREHFGPSIVWALLGMGSSHIVLSPTFGGTFGLFAIWVLTLAYLVKYGAWDLAIRYNYAVGENVFSAYSDIPGPQNWAVWLALIAVINLTVFNTAAVGIANSAFATVFIPLGLVEMYLIYITTTAGIIFIATYNWLERFLMIFVILLAALAVLAVFMGPPETGIIQETTFNLGFFQDPVFIILFASVAGLAPTALSTVFMLEGWALTKNEGARQLKENGLDPENEAYHDYIEDWINTGLRDFKIGYLFSYLLIISLVVLAANVFYPEPPADEDIAFRMGDIMAGAFGEWSFYIVILGAFAALWSTVIAALDGGARAAINILDELTNHYDWLEKQLGEGVDTEWTRRIIVLLFVLASSIPILVLGDLPVTLVIFFGVSLVIIDMFIYPANLYIVLDNLPSKFKPSRKAMMYYLTSIMLFFFFAALGVAEIIGVI